MMKKEMSWEANIHLYRDKTILKQLAIAIGIPFGVVVIFLLWAAAGSTSPSRFYGIYLIILVFGLTFLFLTVVYKNSFHVRYILTQKHITMKMSEKQAKTNKRVNNATMLAGLVTMNPTAMGAGVLASNRQQQTMKLTDIQSIKLDERKHRILVNDSFYEFIIQCTAQNYQDVKNFIQQHSMF